MNLAQREGNQAAALVLAVPAAPTGDAIGPLPPDQRLHQIVSTLSRLPT